MLVASQAVAFGPIGPHRPVGVAPRHYGGRHDGGMPIARQHAAEIRAAHHRRKRAYVGVHQRARGVDRQQRGMDERHLRPLVEKLPRLFENLRQIAIVVVIDADVVARGAADQVVPVLVKPHMARVADIADAAVAELFHRLPGGVFRGVVAHDHLVVRHGLPLHGEESLAQGAGPVAGGNAHRDGGRPGFRDSAQLTSST